MAIKAKLLFPTRYPFIRQAFGNPGAAYGPKGHSGIDLRVINDDTRLVMAAYPGTVIKVDAATDWNTYKPGSKKGNPYGINVLIEHNPEGGEKFWTYYAHLRIPLVKEGQEVTLGQQIGVAGNSGYSTADHLHFEVWNSLTGPNRYVNPEPLLTAERKEVESQFAPAIEEAVIPDWAKEAVEFVEKNGLFKIENDRDVRDAVKFLRLYNLIQKKD